MINETQAQKKMNGINKDQKAGLATPTKIADYSAMGEIFNQAKIEVGAGKVTKKVWENVNQKYPNVAFNAVLKDSALNYLVSNFLFCYEKEEELIQFLKDTKTQVKMDNLRRVYARHTRVIETETVTSDTQMASSGNEPTAKNANDSLSSKIERLAKAIEKEVKDTEISPLEMAEALVKLYKQTPAQRALNIAK